MRKAVVLGTIRTKIRGLISCHRCFNVDQRADAVILVMNFSGHHVRCREFVLAWTQIFEFDFDTYPEIDEALANGVAETRKQKLGIFFRVARDNEAAPAP